jgi:PKD repeat protein
MGGYTGSSLLNDVWRFMSAGSAEQHPVHTYANAGTFTVSLNVTNAGGSNTKTVRDYITVTEPVLPPVSNFSATPTSGTAPLTVRFSDASTNTPTIWNWSFGDGSLVNASVQNPIHTYANAGTFTVSLNATNAGGSNTSTRTNYITVIVPAPVANFSATPTSGTSPLTVRFSDASINNPIAWNWNFGDGSTVNATVQNPVHTYANAGTFTVSLNATNAGGSNTSTRTNYITVIVPAPVANFSASLTSGSAPLTVRFTDSSTNSPTAWIWNFGDMNLTAPWTQVNASAGWSARSGHSSVVQPDGSIVLMGGGDSSGRKNDVWRSTDKGTTWTQVNASAGWSARGDHSSVALSDGSIVLMGGFDGSRLNDVWRSTNNGITWTKVNANAGWSGRYAHSTITMPDDSIVLTGGADNSGVKKDVWRSTDKGTTWTQMTASAGWSARYVHSSVAMPDGSIILMGGRTSASVTTYVNDVWRSTDKGTTWTQMNASAGWSPRTGHSSVVMTDSSIMLMGGVNNTGSCMNDVWQSKDSGATWTKITASATWSARGYPRTVGMKDGSIILMGGYTGSSLLNDVWRFMSAGSAEQHPVHTYANAGTFTVSLNATNAGGSNTSTRTNYITVSVPAPIANFSATPTSGTSPLTVRFSDASINNPIAWTWNFGDGSTVNATVQNPVHTYANAGTFTVSLNATNAGGSNTSTKANYITVIVPPPVANFSVNVTFGLLPRTIRFTDTSTGTPTSWNWSFGDGTNTTVQNPVHTFRLAGNHTISLTATNAGGSNMTVREKFIIIYPKGDFNHQWRVDIGDATRVAYMVIGKEPEQVPDADFNGNGAVDIGDAAKIAYFVVGKIPEL